MRARISVTPPGCEMRLGHEGRAQLGVQLQLHHLRARGQVRVGGVACPDRDDPCRTSPLHLAVKVPYLPQQLLDERHLPLQEQVRLV